MSRLAILKISTVALKKLSVGYAFYFKHFHKKVYLKNYLFFSKNALKFDEIC